MTLLSAAQSAIGHDGHAAKSYLAQAMALWSVETSGNPVTPQRRIGRGALTNWQVKKVEDYIAGHLDVPMGTRELAPLTKLSAGHFSRTFHYTVGMTPRRYIAQQRVRRAQEMLLKSSESLSNIALQCGLADQSHLTRVFRQVVGMPPGVWRRQLRRLSDVRSFTAGFV
jgi:transcriptional regulator GlxA family with amidase domain